MLGRGGLRLFWPGWQVHLSQAFPPGLPSTTGVQGAGCKPCLVLRYPPRPHPTALPSCRAPAMGAAWLPHPKSRSTSPAAVRRHPGWHPGLSPDASPPLAGKTLSSSPTHGLPPGLPSTTQQDTHRCTELPHGQHPNREVHGTRISPAIPAHPTIMKSCIPRRSWVEKDEVRDEGCDQFYSMDTCWGEPFAEHLDRELFGSARAYVMEGRCHLSPRGLPVGRSISKFLEVHVNRHRLCWEM